MLSLTSLIAINELQSILEDTGKPVLSDVT